jgi:hypothetical protein
MLSREGSRIGAQGVADRDAHERSPERASGFALVMACQGPGQGTIPLTWRHFMNSARGIVFKRCGCTDGKTGRQLAGRCPRLAEPWHGTWYYAVQVTTVGGRKARYRRDGFATRDAAAAARQAILDAPADEAAAGAWTVARWLRHWLAQAEPPPAPVHRARLPRPHRPLPHPQHRPHHPRRPHRQAPAGRLQHALPPAHPQRDAGGRLHRRPGPGDTAVGAQRRRPRGPHRRQSARPGPARNAGPAAPGHPDRRASRPGAATASARRSRSGRCGSSSPS